MTNERWKKWIPDKNVCKKYYVNEVFDKDELSISLSNDYGECIIVIWRCIVESYILQEKN